MKKKVWITIFVLLCFLSSPLTSVFSMPVYSPVVVQVSNSDSSVDTAIQQITQKQSNAIVVRYGTLRYAFLISRVHGPVIWVGHGNSEGISVGKEVISWERFANKIQLTPGKDVVLACDSYNLREYVDPSQALTFADALDATIGAQLVLFLLTQNVSYLHMAIQRYYSIRYGQISPKFLMLINEGGPPPPPPPPPPPSNPPSTTKGLDFFEKVYWTAIFVIDIVEFVVLVHPIDVKGIAKKIAEVIAKRRGSGKEAGFFGRVVERIRSSRVYNSVKNAYTTVSTFFQDVLEKFVYEFRAGGVDFCLKAGDLKNLIFAAFGAGLDAVNYALSQADILEWLWLGAEFALTVASIILSASTVFWMKMAGFIIGLALDIMDFWTDLND